MAGREAEATEVQLSPREVGVRTNAMIDTMVAHAKAIPNLQILRASLDASMGTETFHARGVRMGREFEIDYKDKGVAQKGVNAPLTREKTVSVRIEGGRRWGWLETTLLVDKSTGKEEIIGAENGRVFAGYATDEVQTAPLYGKPLPPVTEETFSNANAHLSPLLVSTF